MTFNYRECNKKWNKILWFTKMKKITLKYYFNYFAAKSLSSEALFGLNVIILIKMI